MGKYKAAMANNAITTIHIMMINMPLICGFSAKRWCKRTNVMIAKDPGIVKRNIMRIIQIVEADQNLILVIVFGK